jgi:hypothetical protein
MMVRMRMRGRDRGLEKRGFSIRILELSSTSTI